MPGIIGHNVIGANVDVTSFNSRALVRAADLYTAVAGDVVTDVNWYGEATSGHLINMAVYDVIAGTPTNRVGAVIPFGAATYSLGWHAEAASLALVAGTVYTIAVGFTGNYTTRDDIIGIISTSFGGWPNMGATWVPGATSTRTRSQFATVGGGAPPATGIIFPCRAQLIT